MAHRRRRSFFLILACLTLVLGAGGVGVWKVLDTRPARYTRTAREALRKGDAEKASLLVRHALQLRPNFLPACLVMADICDRKRLPEALLWRKLIVDLSGGSAESLLSYASAALTVGDATRAESALAEIKPADRRRPECQALLGLLAFGLGQYAKAETHYIQAARAAPGNAFYRTQVGWAQAMSEDYFKREKGRNALAEIAASFPDQALAASRALIMGFEAQGELSSARRESDHLVKNPRHTFVDELLRVRLLHDIGAPEFTAELTAIQNQAAANASNTARLLYWMNSAGLADDAVTWVTVRNPKIGNQAELRPAIAMCYLTAENWEALHRLTGDASWDSSEHIRHAYRSRVLRQTGNLLVAYSEWKMAINAAVNQADKLRWLVKTATDWNWPDQTAEALWAAAGQSSIAQWALETLYVQYNAQKDSGGLRRVATRLLALNPHDENMQNNFAMFSLLTGENVERAVEIIEALYKKHPQNPDYASTYAYSLFMNGRAVEALETLEALPVGTLLQPSFAAYYGVILASTHDSTKALRYLEIARAASLFPEEQKLVSDALATVQEAGARTIETASDSTR